MQKSLVFLLTALLFSTFVFGQSDKKTGMVKGKIINGATKSAFSDVRVILTELNTFSNSEASGEFSFADVPFGTYTLIIGGVNAKRDTLSVTVDKEVTDLGDIVAKPNEVQTGQDENEIPTIAVEENQANDDESTSDAAQTSSSFYTVNNDDFLKTAAITFGQYHFRPRGYNNADVQVNGIPLQDLETGYASFNQIGGLNDELRNRTITYGLKTSPYTFGSVTGSTYISATAADQRKGTSISYMATNRSYRNRLMATYNTGVNKKGWAYSLSLSRRWSKEGYVPGTFYDATSFYGAVSKMTKKGQMNLTVLGAPTKRGKAGVAIDELQNDLTDDHYYNPNWGYQNGEKRNMKVANSFQPIIIANYTHTPNRKLRWNTALAYQFGKYGSTDIDFYNGYNPDPDYYKNLPSYYLNLSTPNIAGYNLTRQAYMNNPGALQVQWDNLYQANYANYENIYNINGTNDSLVNKRRSIYVLKNEIEDTRKIVLNSNFEYVVSKHLTVTGGLTAAYQQDEYYRVADDLLGGDYFVNFNQFAAQQLVGNTNYTQNNLKKPNA